MAVTGAMARKLNVETAERLPVEQASVDVLMREFLPKKVGEGDSTLGVSTGAADLKSTPPRRDFDMATELLDRATKAFDLLIDRCQSLEHDLNETQERAQAHATEQESVIEQWRRLASGLKAQADVSDKSISTLKARCEAAEARALASEQKAAALERTSVQAVGHAAMAEQLSTKLHDKVVSAFGLGSRAHLVLEAVATRTSAE